MNDRGPSLLAMAAVVAVVVALVILVFFAIGFLLGRAFLQTVRESGHRRLIYASLVGLVVFIGVLTYLGIELPREGH